MQITQVLNSYETVSSLVHRGTTTNTNLSIIDRLTNGVVTISLQGLLLKPSPPVMVCCLKVNLRS